LEQGRKEVIPTDSHRRLIDAALDARSRAYAPYSKFAVGAALLTPTGEIITGANVENASYGLSICAERAAVLAAVAAGHRDFAALAIAASGGATPCGACRQVLAEFATDLPILLIDADNHQSVTAVTLANLLPGRFELRRLS
jgi:cytidine deaminase